MFLRQHGACRLTVQAATQCVPLAVLDIVLLAMSAGAAVQGSRFTMHRVLNTCGQTSNHIWRSSTLATPFLAVGPRLM